MSCAYPTKRAVAAQDLDRPAFDDNGTAVLEREQSDQWLAQPFVEPSDQAVGVGAPVRGVARVVERIDTAEKKLYVDRTKEQIKNSPDYDELADNAEYRERLGSYYSDMYSPRM